MEMLLANTFGKIWMLGGSVTKEFLFRMNDPAYERPWDYYNHLSTGVFLHRDFDFIAEEISGHFRLSRGWTIATNTFGGVKLKSKTITVDLWKLRKHDPCRRNGLDYTIENVLHLVPLTTQAIAVDLKENKVIGDVGKRALETRTVGVNHHGEALHYCKVYHTTIEEMLYKKALEYSFTPIFPKNGIS